MNRKNYYDKLRKQLPQEIKNRIEKISLDNTSGATELAKQAAETLMFLADHINVSSISQLNTYIEITAYALVKAQSTMAPIFNLANKTLLAVNNLTNAEEIRQTVNASCHKFIKELDKADQTVSKFAADLVRDKSTIIVHSYSSTVLKALQLAKKEKKDFDIICTESRPMKEGMHLAKKLGEEGIKVTFIVDSAVFTFLPDAHAVFVGADSISSYGLVNKIGTLGLAIAAKEFKTDLYALCSSEKILPPSHKMRLRNIKDPQEILPATIENVAPINFYFDLTPLSYLTGIITEGGIMTPTQIKQYIKRLRIHPMLSN
ncbi:MAG: translation initiation factor eIF-2B [Petrotogales bacterium]